MKTAVAVFALPQEIVQVHLPGYKVETIVCGVGKARAAIATMKAIARFRPQLVVSVGSVGTFKHRVGDIMVSTHFVDRDFAKLKLPGIRYEAHSKKPENLNLPSIVEGNEVWQADYVVSTGDDFVTAGEADNADVVDMEAYAEWLACEEMNVDFLAVKYVTDVIGQNSVEIWEDKLADARHALNEYFRRFE